MPNQILIPEHHSLVDWDFEPHIRHILDSTTYIVAPSSIRVWGDVSYRRAILSRRTNCQCVPEGCVQTGLRAARAPWNGPAVTFHNQAPFNTANLDNCYFTCYPEDTYCGLYRMVDSVLTLIGRWSLSTPANTWFQRRWFFWKEGTFLIIRLEIWDGAKWVALNPDAMDSTPPWLNSPINRLGLSMYTHLNTNAWFDETFLYRRAPD